MFHPANLTRADSALAGLALLAACTSSQSQNEAASAMLPQPSVVIVQDFAAAPEEVKLAEGLMAEVKDIAAGKPATPRTAQERQVGRQVADAIADKLVVEIRDLGLQAERGSAVPPGTANALLLVGQLVSIDE